MTTTGEHGEVGAGRGPRALRGMLLHGAGFILALLLLPVFWLFELPIAGWAIGAGAVLANRVLGAVVAWMVRDSSTSVVLGAVGFSMIFRALATALMLFFVGAKVGATGDRTVGLGQPDLAMPAILVFLLCYTVDAGIEAIRRSSDRETLAISHPTTVESNA